MTNDPAPDWETQAFRDADRRRDEKARRQPEPPTAEKPFTRQEEILLEILDALRRIEQKLLSRKPEGR
jgi:hypothetical protein